MRVLYAYVHTNHLPCTAKGLGSTHSPLAMSISSQFFVTNISHLYKPESKSQPPCRNDFSGRASKAQDESGTIYSARKEMHSEPDRSMINGYNSQFKDAPPS